MAKQPSQSEESLQSGGTSPSDDLSLHTPLTAPEPAGAVTYAPETNSTDNTLAENERSPGLTLRSVLLCLALSVGFGYLIPIIDMKMRNTFLGATHLPPGAVGVLLIVLLLINPASRAFAARQKGRSLLLGAAVILGAVAVATHLTSRGQLSGWAVPGFWLAAAASGMALLIFCLGPKPLTRNESLTVYISCLFSCLTPGHGAENVFVVNLIGPFYYATRENQWLRFLEPYLAPWLTPALGGGKGYNDANQAVVNDWFNAARDAQVPWGAWLVPLLIWGFFIAVLYTMMACLCVILRKQWAEREALSFPLLRLPLELTKDMDEPQTGLFNSFFHNPMMWGGVGIAIAIQALRGLNLYFPDVPTVPLDINTGPLFSEAPWNQIGAPPIMVWPVIVGISYLLTTEISFSFWFFFWFVKFQLIAAYYLGFMPASLPNAVGAMGGGFKTFTFYQQIGVYLAYVALVLWSGREHLKHVARRGFGRIPASSDEREEALSYPVAFWGFVLSLTILLGWSVAIGIAPHLAVIFWGLYLVIIIALTRIVSEAGILFVQQGWVPLGTLAQITNSGSNHWLLAEKSLPGAALLQGSLMTDLRGFLMPSFMQSFKLAKELRIPLRPLLALVMVCSLIGMAMGAVMNVKLGYEQGGLGLDPWYAGGASTLSVSQAQLLSKGVGDASWSNMIWVALGAALTLGFMAARARFVWFQLHPIGFLVAHSYPIGSIWFSIFLGWLAKVLITRYAGTSSYRKTMPLFLGLALGDVAMMLFWLLIDGWQGRVGHKLMPG